MSQSLLFIPDISGYTEFVKSTEKVHGQQVIAELLEALIEANTLDMKIAEIEGDAVFFYLESELPSMERLLAQVEEMFSGFHSHLKMLDTNRICPCRACVSAQQLQLKIIAHSADLEFIEVQGNRKPFGQEVIEAHRLLKNSVESNNYVLFSQELAKRVMLPDDYKSKLFQFQRGGAQYDGIEIKYVFSNIENSELTLKPANAPDMLYFSEEPNYSNSWQFEVPADALIEYISNYQYRHHWVTGVDEFKYDPKEVTKLGTEHMCIINHKHLNFVAVTKAVNEDELVYGEMTKDTPFLDRLYSFFIIKELGQNRSELTSEVYAEVDQWWKKPIVKYLLKAGIANATKKSVQSLQQFATTAYQAG